MNRYSRIVEYLSSHPWAIQREKLDAIVELIRLRVEGGRLGDDEIAQRLAVARAEQGRRQGESFTGVIPIYGVIMPKANLMTEMSGGTTIDSLRVAFRSAMADDEISRIVFDVDSPGGSVEGVSELAAEIRAARGVKPMTAVANYTMASAAYWLASQADEIVGSPSSLVGSIGVYGVHEDHSVANELEGVKPTYISAGRYKTEGNSDEPLGDEARAHIQSLVDASYELFVNDVAAGRGVSPQAVRDGYGEARALHPGAALRAGLIDRVDTLEAAISAPPPQLAYRAKSLVVKVDNVDVTSSISVTSVGETGSGSVTITDPAALHPDQPDVEASDEGLEIAADVFAFEQEHRRRHVLSA